MPELLLEPNTYQINTVKNNIRRLLNNPIADPSTVIVFLTASRSGSSCLFDVLTRSPDVVSLQGEIEPYLKITNNALNKDIRKGNQIDEHINIDELRAFVRGSLIHKHHTINNDLIKSIHFLKNKAKTLEDIINNAKFITQEKLEYNSEDIKLIDKKSKEIIKEFSNKIKEKNIFNKDILENIIKELVKKYETNFKGVGQPLRIALTGSKFGPGIYDIILSLNKDRVLMRLNNFN